MKQLSGCITVVLVCMLVTAASAAAQVATVRGTVRLAATGAPVPGAHVLLFSADDSIRHRTITDSAGRYRLAVSNAGPYRLLVRTLDPPLTELIPLSIQGGDQLNVNVEFVSESFALDPLAVDARRPVETMRVQEFHERASLSRSLGRGRIFTREDIERIQPRSAESLLGTAPSSRCTPEIRLDGTPATAPDLRNVTAGALEGMEIYIGAEVPNEFRAPGLCGIALVWTRTRPEGMRDMGVVRVLVAIGLTVGAFVLAR